MSDSDELGVTYTEVSSPFEDLSDIGSPRADDHEHLELPRMLEDPYIEVALQAAPSPDYIPGPEEPEQAPPLPDYVPGPEHADDEIVPEDQPYAEDASPTAQSPEYVPEFNLEAYLKEDDDEDPKEDPVDNPADGGDDSDNEEGSSEDDKDDDMDIEADEEEEDHPAPAKSVVAASTSHSSPLPPPFILSPTRSDAPSSGIPPPLPISTPTSSLPLQLPSASRREDKPEVTLTPRKRLGITLGPGYEVGKSSSAAAARPAEGLRADYGFVATIDREIRRDPERGWIWDHRLVRRDDGDLTRSPTAYTNINSDAATTETSNPTTLTGDHTTGTGDHTTGTGDNPTGTGDSLTGTGYRTTGTTRTRWSLLSITGSIPASKALDCYSERQLLAGRINMLFRERRAHAYTRHLIETEARLYREAWVQSVDVSDLARGEVMSLRTTVLGQTTEIRELHTADRRRQIVISKMLRADHRRSA
nr:hypothetical protein [Tanacetum cinerariifolium]